MSKQLQIDFAPNDSNCSECGEAFPQDALNHWQLCSECVEDLETRADFLDTMTLLRDGMTADEKAQEVLYVRERAKEVRFIQPE